LTTLTDVIVATGGGAILDPATRQRLSATGTVVYLHATVDAQLKRTQPSRNRPLLSNQDPRQVLERLMETRGPLYDEIADLRIDTTGKEVRSVAERLRELLDASA
jgi:shikimate kinase